jgi:exonuclease SbcC
MDKFRILQIHIYNFKGFKELSLDLSSNSFTILGGKNGFGKTTLFDAIELVLSGSIKRMSQYVTNADKRYNYNGKPLVYDCSIQTVYVEILVELESGIYWLKREAMVEDIKNPIDFSIFSTLYIRPNIDKVEYAITKDSDILPSSIIKQYKFLHYLDQEECTAFLKSNEKSRNELVTKLFRTQNFDNDLSKMVDCKAKLDSIIITNKDRLENIDRKLNILRNAGTLEGDLEEIEYIPLTKTLPEWDKENPKLNINQYLELLSENGLIDNIRYFVDNNNEYNKYKIAKYLAPYLDDENSLTLAQYVHYKNKRYEIILFEEYKATLERLFDDFDIYEIRQFSIERYKSLSYFVSNEALTLLTEKVNAIKDFYPTCTSVQQEYTQMLSRRESLIKSFDSIKLDNKSKCPLCGHVFANAEILIAEIAKQGESFKQISDTLTHKLMSLYDDLKKYYKTNILDPIISIIKNENLSQEVVDSVKNVTIEKFVKDVEIKWNVKFNPQANIEETQNYCKTLLTSLTKSYDATIDYARLDTFYEEYREIIIKENLTHSNITKKRAYIISKWKEYSSKEIQNLSKEREKLLRKYSYCESKSKTIKKIVDQIKKQKRDYIAKLISDIEILFYIYSGRIMQDNYYGRGIFMKNDLKRVLFVSGSYGDDIDVLYNMSSGQLTSIILAFTLALNKLYADVKYIAIDDPVQTIDDMNLWGFIETLRHEFRDYNVLLSTHENNYAGLLRYKASKMGIKAIFYDMQNFREMTL